MSFKEISIKELNENFVSLIGDEWMLVAAGDEENYNMMTASWGGLGVMWNSPVAVTVIRPQRYTKEFVDANDMFTLSFYGDDKAIHKVCGSESGRDVNKAEKTGLTPVFADNTVYFEQARIVLVCKKMYVQPMSPDSIVDENINKWYENKDYHIMYVGKIEKVLVKE